ncbi:MAG: hypothetical protein KAW92_04250 [Candidatus Cloacimonetes bacterium]|nr:hypothetical protein [Candidatus Cloacimonadota bacterium]
MKEKYKNFKENLEKLYKKFGRIENQGYDIQEFGNALVNDGKIGQAYSKHFLNQLNNYEKLSNDFPEFNPYIQEIMKSSLYILDQLEQVEEKIFASQEHFSDVVLSVSTEVTGATGSLYLAESGINHLEIENPNINIHEKYNIQTPNILEYSRIENEIDSYLFKIDPKLPERRKGAWTTINSTSLDKKAQAAHTMRDILSTIISKLASNAEVKKTEWWKPTPDKKSGVSLKQRIRFLLFGPKNEIENADELENIENKVNKCFKEDSYLKSLAHGSKKGTVELIESIMHSMESTMLQIFKSKEKYGKNEI